MKKKPSRYGKFTSADEQPRAHDHEHMAQNTKAKIDINVKATGDVRTGSGAPVLVKTVAKR